MFIFINYIQRCISWLSSQSLQLCNYADIIDPLNNVGVKAASNNSGITSNRSPTSNLKYRSISIFVHSNDDLGISHPCQGLNSSRRSLGTNTASIAARVAPTAAFPCNICCGAAPQTKQPEASSVELPEGSPLKLSLKKKTTLLSSPFSRFLQALLFPNSNLPRCLLCFLLLN